MELEQELEEVNRAPYYAGAPAGRKPPVTQTPYNDDDAETLRDRMSGDDGSEGVGLIARSGVANRSRSRHRDNQTPRNTDQRSTGEVVEASDLDRDRRERGTRERDCDTRGRDPDTRDRIPDSRGRDRETRDRDRDSHDSPRSDYTSQDEDGRRAKRRSTVEAGAGHSSAVPKVGTVHTIVYQQAQVAPDELKDLELRNVTAFLNQCIEARKGYPEFDRN